MFILFALLIGAASVLLCGDLTEQRGIDVRLYVETVASTYTLVGALRSVDVTINGESIDASHAGSGGWRNKLGSLKDWEVSAGSVLLMDLEEGGFDPAFQFVKGLMQGNTPGSNECGLRITWPDTSTDAGLAIATEVSVSSPYDGVAEGSLNFEGNGPLVYTPYDDTP